LKNTIAKQMCKCLFFDSLKIAVCSICWSHRLSYLFILSSQYCHILISDTYFYFQFFVDVVGTTLFEGIGSIENSDWTETDLSKCKTRQDIIAPN
jgi:hypothetical protein